MAAFELEPDPGLVSPGELAVLVAREDGRAQGLKGPELEGFVGEHALTDQTIRNYAKEQRVPVARLVNGRYLFDPAVAVEAVRANRPQPTHGGKRRKAGRRKRTPAPEQAFSDAADYRDTVDEMRERADEGRRPPAALPVETLLNLNAEQLRIVLAHGDAAGAGQASLDRLERTLKIQALERKHAVEAGRLMDADAAERAWTATQRAVKSQLDGLPARVADRLAQAAWVSPETVDLIVRDLHAAGVPADTLDTVRGALAMPNGLAGRIRAVVADEVRAVGERIAGDTAQDEGSR